MFLPGHRGHFEQAAQFGNVINWLGVKIDLFTLDFEEEFSAFHGSLLRNQAHFAAAAVDHILFLYNYRALDLGLDRSTIPTSVVLMGHSMGG